MEEPCCPDWKYRQQHASNCYYAEETWPRVGRAFISAMADWLEKRLILMPSNNAPSNNAPSNDAGR